MNANKQDAGGEVTNPDNVGGLLEAAESIRRLAGVIRQYGTCAPSALETVADRIGELCRAAPAGGDAEVVRLRQLLAGTQEQFRVVSELLERNQAHHERMMKLMDSAPAGAGQMADRTAFERHFTTGHQETDLRNFQWNGRRYTQDRIDALWEGWCAALLRKLQQGAE